MTRQTLQMASAYMSVVIGGGFASGQEILQFFTSFGWIGLAGTLVAAALFAFTGWQLARISAISQAQSHKQVLNTLFGHKLGFAIDLLLSFFLLGVGVAMLAGAGSLFEEDFGTPLLVGALFMTILVALTLCLNIQRIVALLSAITPILLALVVILAVYALYRSNADLDTLNQLAAQNKKAAPNWFLSGALHAAFNISVGFPMLAVMAGGKNLRSSSQGAIIGGLGLGLLIFLLATSLFFNLDLVASSEVPMLVLAKDLHPLLGYAMSFALLAMMYTTSVGMFFAFTARFARVNTQRFRLLSLVACFGGLALSFAGFTTLVGTVYPLTGYLGLALIAGTIWYWYRLRKHRSDKTGQNQTWHTTW